MTAASTPPGVPAGLLAAWQGALAAELRAQFGYGLIGAHLNASAQVQLATTCQSAHDALADRTAAAIAGTGRVPVAAQPDYPQLYPVTDRRQAIAAAVTLEDGCAAAWRYLYGAAAGTAGGLAGRLRGTAQQALIDSAVRAAQWRAITDPDRASVAFPGLN